ncbi:MAG: LacI family DNA-binding transcriptional regulator [Bacteroidia bacterium]
MNKSLLSGVKEIARRGNVSLATVDRVIHKRSGVANETRNKIIAIINELDYQPNLLARRLASRKIIQLATLIPKVSQEETTYWEAPLQGILQAEKQINQYGIKLVKYFFDQNDRKSFAEQTKLIIKNKADGIILAPSFIEESIQFTQSCAELNIPYVFINSDIPNQESLCYFGPELYQSGYFAAHLINYLIGEGKILIVNISKEITNNLILRKEEGFSAFFRENNKLNDIIRSDIRETNFTSVQKILSQSLKDHSDIQVIYVTNSRVSAVARFLEKAKRTDILLLGYDFLDENIEYLKKGIIDFLICQKPKEQAYLGIMALYHYLVFGSVNEKVHFMPIDIITKENYLFYRN